MYTTLKRFNELCAPHNLILVRGEGYFYWASDDDNVGLTLAGLYTTSIDIFAFSHAKFAFWHDQLTLVLKAMNGEPVFPYNPLVPGMEN